MNSADRLGQEWMTLQNNFEQHERNALVVKLFAVALLMLGLAFEVNSFYLGFLLLVLWFQEGILRTFQSRIGQRILQIEAWVDQLHHAASSASVPAPQGAAFQLHSAWQAVRPGGITIVAEYLANAVRPTVAFPYAVLLALMLLFSAVS